jgi:hypothetical protein
LAQDEPVFDVMVGKVGDTSVNTLILDRTDLVVPLERDFDDDPLQDDEVWLKDASDEVVKKLLSSDPDVTDDPDKGLRFYKFRDLAYGMYSVWIVVGGQPREVIPGVAIRRTGVFFGSKKLLEKHSRPPVAAAPEAEPEESEPEGPEPWYTDYQPGDPP